MTFLGSEHDLLMMGIQVVRIPSPQMGTGDLAEFHNNFTRRWFGKGYPKRAELFRWVNYALNMLQPDLWGADFTIFWSDNLQGKWRNGKSTEPPYKWQARKTWALFFWRWAEVWKKSLVSWVSVDSRWWMLSCLNLNLLDVYKSWVWFQRKTP